MPNTLDGANGGDGSVCEQYTTSAECEQIPMLANDSYRCSSSADEDCYSFNDKTCYEEGKIVKMHNDLARIVMTHSRYLDCRPMAENECRLFDGTARELEDDEVISNDDEKDDDGDQCRKINSVECKCPDNSSELGKRKSGSLECEVESVCHKEDDHEEDYDDDQEYDQDEYGKDEYGNDEYG